MMSRPSKVIFDPSQHFFYKKSPLGDYKIENSPINSFYDQIMKYSIENEKKISLVSSLTDNNMIEPSYFVEVLDTRRDKMLDIVFNAIGTRDAKIVDNMKLDAEKIVNDNVMKEKESYDRNPFVTYYKNLLKDSHRIETEIIPEKTTIGVYGGAKKRLDK